MSLTSDQIDWQSRFCLHEHEVNITKNFPNIKPCKTQECLYFTKRHVQECVGKINGIVRTIQVSPSSIETTTKFSKTTERRPSGSLREFSNLTIVIPEILTDVSSNMLQEIKTEISSVSNGTNWWEKNPLVSLGNKKRENCCLIV
jgi:hypothetical protein